MKRVRTAISEQVARARLLSEQSAREHVCVCSANANDTFSLGMRVFWLPKCVIMGAHKNGTGKRVT